MHDSVAIRIQGLHFSFLNDGKPLCVIDDLALGVPEGQFVSIVGPSGCGKSTLLRLLCGLFDTRADVAQQGSVSVFGEAPAKARKSFRIGLVPQQPTLLPWRRVLANVELPLELRGSAEVSPGPYSGGIIWGPEDAR